MLFRAKTKRDGQTDGQTDGRMDGPGGRCNISRPRAYGMAGDNKLLYWVIKYNVVHHYGWPCTNLDVLHINIDASYKDRKVKAIGFKYIL